jgi:error-prone DNA polymerase
MIIHLDADAFYASVEQAADPKLRGKAIAVGGEKRGIIASASYEARKLGIYTPMPTVRARKLCPRLIVIPGDFEKYEQFSRFMFSYAYDFTPNVEIASIDEGYFDLGTNRKKCPVEVASTIRKAIAQSLKISVSEGIASNKLVSQVASKLNKPACFLEVPQGTEKQFLSPLPNRWLPGVGPKLAGILNAAGLSFIQQIGSTPSDLLSLIVGSYAPQLKEFANGIDERPVIADKPGAKSYGEQQTFDQDVTDEAFILATLRGMADRLMAKVREDKKNTRTLTLRLRYNDMDEVTRSISFDEPTDLENDVYPLLPGMLKRAWERRVSVRLVGLKLSNIYDGIFRCELALDADSHKHESQRKMAAVIDQLRRDYRPSAAMRGHDLWLKKHDNRPRADLARKPTIPKLPVQAPRKAAVYVPLNIKSYYSFLDSTLSISAIIETAKMMGIKALALTDPNLHGAVEFFTAAKEAGIKPIIAAEVHSLNLKTKARRRLNLYVQNQAGYENLCRILSQPKLHEDFLAGHLAGLIQVPVDSPSIALPEIRYRLPADRQKYDIIQSIRTLTLLHEAHPDKREGDFHFPDPAAAGAIYERSAIDATLHLADRCEFEFELNRLRFPLFSPPDRSTSEDFLRQLAFEGLKTRYGSRSPQFQTQLGEELAIIHDVGYEDYFLTVWDFLQECRRRDIHWITRGSAADSLVCYCLGISGVCPIRFELYFRRFLNKDRMALNKLPDIDIDFAHDRKDDVVDLIFERYGSEHVAVVGGFNTYQARSAVADIAKVLGVSEFQIRRLTEHIPWTAARNVQAALTESQGGKDTGWEEEPYKTAVELAVLLDGFPRHPKMHPCGLVLSRDPIQSLTPVFTSSKGYPTTHFDMDAVESVGLVKMDILAQGGLAVIRDSLRLLAERGIKPDLENLEPWADPNIWEMIASGEARGVHHIESPAMISLSKMCNVRDIDCLIAIVSVIRPGAANNMKKVQFARRAQGLDPVDYVHPSLSSALRSTFGVVAYEEHILQICEAFAGLNPGRADVLRRALGKQQTAKIEEIRQEFIFSAKTHQRTDADIENVWNLVAGFQGYAFCRAHSTAYGVEAYQGAFLKCYHPAEFLASVLSNGKGFYSTLAYTIECRRLGIDFLPPDVNASRGHFFPEPSAAGVAIRVPLRQVKDLTTATLERYEVERAKAPFLSMHDFYMRVGASVQEMQNLIRVGAFDAFGEKRTAQTWTLHHLARTQPDRQNGSIFPLDTKTPLPEIPLTEPTVAECLKSEMELLGFTVSGHPLDQYAAVAWETYCPIKGLAQYANQTVTVCGLIIQDRMFHQVTGDVMKFLTICDYSGMVECELFADAYRRFGITTIRYPVVELTATVMPYENGLGYSLQVQRVGKPRQTQ